MHPCAPNSNLEGCTLKLRNAAFIASLLLTVTAAMPVLAADTSQTIIYSNCDASLSGTVGPAGALF